jgi:hypothetical protein
MLIWPNAGSCEGFSTSLRVTGSPVCNATVVTHPFANCEGVSRPCARAVSDECTRTARVSRLSMGAPAATIELATTMLVIDERSCNAS